MIKTKTVQKILTLIGIPSIAILIGHFYTVQNVANDKIIDSKEEQIKLLTEIRKVTLEEKDVAIDIKEATIESKNAQIELLEAFQSDLSVKRLLNAKKYYREDLNMLMLQNQVLMKKLDSLGITIDKIKLAMNETNELINVPQIPRLDFDMHKINNKVYGNNDDKNKLKEWFGAAMIDTSKNNYYYDPNYLGLRDMWIGYNLNLDFESYQGLRLFSSDTAQFNLLGFYYFDKKNNLPFFIYNPINQDLIKRDSIIKNN